MDLNLPRFPDLAGKRVLVTGASTGIGAAAAIGFGQNGARVAVHYNASRQPAEEVARQVEAAGGKALLVAGDVTERGVPERIVDEVTAAFGGIDVLVNNAGGLGGRVALADWDDAFIDNLFDLNARQVIHFMRAATKGMIAENRGGVCINVSSIAARSGGGGGTVLYSATKGFISTATRGWAKELAPHKIRVNAVSPGVITTPLHERHSSPQQMAAMQAGVPMGRLGAPEECVATFLYLASEAASGYVTGQIIEVNGGQYMP